MESILRNIFIMKNKIILPFLALCSVNCFANKPVESKPSIVREVLTNPVYGVMTNIVATCDIIINISKRACCSSRKRN